MPESRSQPEKGWRASFTAARQRIRGHHDWVDKRTARAAFGGLGAAIVIGVWVLLVQLRVESPLLLPGPVDVFDALRRMFTTGKIWPDLLASGRELLFGYVLAGLTGVFCGLIVGWYRILGLMVDPLVNFFYAIPRIALAPLILIWLGIGVTSKVAIVFLVSVFPVLFTTIGGVRSLESSLVRMSRCFGANDARVFRTVVLPGSVPYILSGLRIASGQALVGVFVAELFGAKHGVGLLMSVAADNFKTAEVFGALFLFATTGVILTGFLRHLERRSSVWRI
jgi:NitT/TauT family transport system permease protein